MITLVTADTVDLYGTVCDTEPILGTKMHTQLAVYGMDATIATHWVAVHENGAGYAAILRFDAWMIIVPNGLVDLEELISFLQAVGGFGAIESTPELCRQLLETFPGEYNSSLTMAAVHGEDTGMEQGTICDTPPLQEVYRLICMGSRFMTENTRWDTFYPHTSHLLRHKLGLCSMLYQEGEPVATGGVYTMGPRHGVIGSLTTHPAFRGRGYGRILTRHLMNRCYRIGKIPAVYCAQDSLADFYRPLGFVPFGQWGEIILAH